MAPEPRSPIDPRSGRARPAAALADTTPAAGEAARLLLDAPREELRRRIGQLVTLYQIGRAISESRNWTEALEYFLATLRDDWGVQGAAILLWSRETTVLAPRTVLGLAPDDVERAVGALLAAWHAQPPTAVIHPLDCWTDGALRCAGHTAAPWDATVLPLLYRRTPLGFLLIDKPYSSDEFDAELFFLQTIQTILGEEVANAVQWSKLVDLKNFNEAVLDNVASGVVTVNERGTITFANRLGRELLGLDAGAPLDPDLAFDVRFEVPSGPAHATLRDRSKGPRGVDGQVRGSDGQRIPVRLRQSRILDPGDSEPLLVVAFEDLRPQRRLEEQARRAERLRSLGELSAAIAHEVRNPLQGISLTLSNLRELVQPGAEPYLAVIFDEMQRLDGIVGGILDFARPAPPVPSMLDLATTLARGRDLALEHATRRGVQIDIVRDTADDRCEVDEGQILQVLLNLVRNAVDASPAGDRVSIRLFDIEPAGESVGIAVHDRGAGIPADTQAKLFVPFFTTKSDGTGLGLAVCQKIVQEHGGTIQVTSEPGQGTTFTVELPRRFAGAAFDQH